MKKKQLLLPILAATMMSSCTSHYRLESVDRTRIIVDSRYDAQPDAEAAAFVAPFKRVNDSIMGPVVGQVAHNMHATRPESDLSNLMADILVWAAKDYNEHPVLGIYNMGGIRADLTKGDVTYGDVLNIAPFENKICFLTLTGKKVTELFQQIARRGGEGVSRGVELVISRDHKLLSARLGGKEICPDSTYRVTTINYLLEGNDGMPALHQGTDVIAPDDPSNNTRFLIMNFFRDMQAHGIAVDSKVEGRIAYEKQ